MYLQEYKRKLNFTTDTWTLLNHHMFVTFSMHFKHQGEKIALPLNVVKVTHLHTGVELIATFIDVLVDFRIEAKVC